VCMATRGGCCEEDERLPLGRGDNVRGVNGALVSCSPTFARGGVKWCTAGEKAMVVEGRLSSMRRSALTRVRAWDRDRERLKDDRRRGEGDDTGADRLDCECGMSDERTVAPIGEGGMAGTETTTIGFLAGEGFVSSCAASAFNSVGSDMV
jgi:hypothetical protein